MDRYRTIWPSLSSLLAGQSAALQSRLHQRTPDPDPPLPRPHFCFSFGPAMFTLLLPSLLASSLTTVAVLPVRSAGLTAITTTVTESQTHTVFVAVEAATHFTSFVPINGLPAGGTRPKLTSTATSSTAAVTDLLNGLPVAGLLTVTPDRTQTTSFPTTTMPVPYGYYAPSSSATVASPTGNRQGMIQETSHKRIATPTRANAITQGSKSTFTSCAKAYSWPGVC